MHLLVRTIACLFAGLTLVWFWLDRSAPSWDDAWYLSNSLTMYDSLCERGLFGFVKQFFTVLGFKPPLITALPTPFYLILGRNWHFAYLVNVVAMCVLFAAVYGIGKRLFSARAGVFAVFVAATMPLLYGLSRWFLVEYTLTAMVAVGIWLLLVSKIPEFGVLCAFGLLLKVSFPLYVAVPFGVAVWRSERRGRVVLCTLTPCVLLALPWYVMHGHATVENAIAAAYSEVTTKAQGTGAVLSLDAILGYLNIVIRDGISVWYAGLLGVLVLYLMVRDRGRLRELAPVLLWMSPFLIFVFAGNKDIRYAAPLYPAIALAAGFCLDAVFRKSWIAWAALVVPMVSFLCVSFQWPMAEPSHRYARRFDRTGWPHDPIVEAIAANAGSPGRVGVILVGSDREGFNANNFELAVKQYRLPFLVASTAYEKELSAVLRAADSASAVVWKEGGEPESPYFNVYAQQLVEHVRGSETAQEIPYAPKLPDGGVARIFRNRRVTSFLSKDIDEIPAFPAVFGKKIALTGLSARVDGNRVAVKYAWRAVQKPDREYWCFTHVVNQKNEIAGFLDHRLLGGDPPVTAWKPGDRAAESLTYFLPVGFSGAVRLRIGLYHVATGERLPVVLEGKAAASLADAGTAVVVEAQSVEPRK